MALSWLIHTRIGDPFYLGLRTFAAELPLIAFMLVGGRWRTGWTGGGSCSPRRSSRCRWRSPWACSTCSVDLGIAAILVIAFLTGLAQSQSAPTYQATLTSLVPPEKIPNAVALNSLQFNLSRAIGPVIAGLLLARVGTGACFAANALSFVAVIVAIWRIELPPIASPSKESLGQSLLAGIRHVRESPILSILTVLGATGSFLAFPAHHLPARHRGRRAQDGGRRLQPAAHRASVWGRSWAP